MDNVSSDVDGVDDRVAGPFATAGGFSGWPTGVTSGTHVFAHDSRGMRLVDQATGTGIADLRLHAATLTWTRSGVLQTAALA